MVIATPPDDHRFRILSASPTTTPRLTRRFPVPPGTWPSLPESRIMTSLDVDYLPETPAHDLDIEAINAEAFGPGRFAKAAYKIREGGPHERGLSFVATCAGQAVASVRMTRVVAGQGSGLLLGPLAVRPAYKNLGIGKRLVAIGLQAAIKAGYAAVILVGDEPYYGPLGFKRFPHGKISLPRPVDLNRLLVHEIAPGAVDLFSGPLDHADRQSPCERIGQTDAA